MLLEQMTLVELQSYEGRHRTYGPAKNTIFKNGNNEVIYEEFAIEAASVQPIDGYTLQALAEGYRSKAVYQFWTKTPMRGLEQNTNQLSDQIFLDGEWFSVYNHKPWSRTSFLSHYHCIAIREDVNNSRDPHNTSGENYG